MERETLCWPALLGLLFGYPSTHQHGIPVASLRQDPQALPLTVFLPKLMPTAPPAHIPVTLYSTGGVPLFVASLM